MTTIAAWPGVPLDGVPGPLVRRVMASEPPAATDRPEGPETTARRLAAAAAAQLRSTDPGAVRNSEAAMDLLAADALLTAACRVALEGVDPPATLTAILGTLVGEAAEKEPL